MKIHIFTEGTDTTTEEAEYVVAFFEGGFLPVKDLSTDLAKYGDVSIHIHSDDYGYIKGGDTVNSLATRNKNSSDEFVQAINQASRTADVLVILLTQSSFKDTVGSQCDELVSNAKQESIWCIGALRTSISDVDLKQLQSSTKEVIVYQRVGVARIDVESKERLIEAVANPLKVTSIPESPVLIEDHSLSTTYFSILTIVPLRASVGEAAAKVLADHRFVHRYPPNL